jgi:hypothetical protein
MKPVSPGYILCLLLHHSFVAFLMFVLFMYVFFLYVSKLFCFLSCHFWSLTLRDKRRLRVFENRVLRRVFWPKRDEMTGEWRKVYIEELNYLYSALYCRAFV